jgi:hypothetical protein
VGRCRGTQALCELCPAGGTSLCTNVAGEAWRVAGISLRWAICWRSSVMRCDGSTGSAVGVGSSPGILTGSPTYACRSSLNVVRIPRTRGGASVQYWSAWHMMDAFSVWWKRSTSTLATGWLSVRVECHRAWPRSGKVEIQINVPGRW